MATNTTTTTPLSVAFDPDVAFSGPRTATLFGTVSGGSGTQSVEIFQGTTDLGAATIRQNGTFRFTHDFGAGQQTGLSAVAGDTSGGTATDTADYDLITGIVGGPYTAVQDRFSPGSMAELTGQTFFGRSGAVYDNTAIVTEAGGATTVTHSGGTSFIGQSYFAYTDRFAANGSGLSETLSNKDGTHTITGVADGLILHSVSNDTFTGGGANETFAFTPDFGNAFITDFQARGSTHDTLDLSATQFGSVRQVLNNTAMENGSATIHVGDQDTITLSGVTKSQLAHNPQDFLFA